VIIDLRQATAASLADAVFNHEVSKGAEPWHYGRLDFEIVPERQLQLLAELLHGAPAIFRDYSFSQIEQGLWCMMGGAFSKSFTGLVWNPELPLVDRLEVVAGVYPLYDRVLAASPYEAIDFRYPDNNARRFKTIDYMVPDLLVYSPGFPREDRDDEMRVRSAFLDVFSRLLGHDAPVAQYAALHGLGHIGHHGRRDVIERYLAAHPELDAAQREYAADAHRGHVL
jgi:hypothetical protein